MFEVEIHGRSGTVWRFTKNYGSRRAAIDAVAKMASRKLFTVAHIRKVG